MQKLHRKKTFLIIGARPNFVKVAPVLTEMKKYRNVFKPILVHTGQHYDFEMSKVFFEDLTIPEPDIYLGIGSGKHGEQTGRIMIELEKIFLREKPDLVLVFGDVNSTLGGAIIAAKLLIPLAHVEAGLRSFDRTMPEEINRIITDALSDYLFTTEFSANENLKREGIAEDKIFFVGNVMIDTLMRYLEKAKQSNVLERFHLSNRKYALVTLHRPSNVDIKEVVAEILEGLQYISQELSVIFPVHPRTEQKIKEYGFLTKFEIRSHASAKTKGIVLIPPQKYRDFLALEYNASLILTDSGGIQEESTALGVPCLTLRQNTERPITVTVGTNIVVGTKKERIIEETMKILKGTIKKGQVPPLWDGMTSQRIVETLLSFKSGRYRNNLFLARA